MPRLKRSAAAGTGSHNGPVAVPIAGKVRLGRKTKTLVKRLVPGEIAVIDHVDLDRISAEELIASGIRSVVNVAPSSTDRYPNSGPLVLARAGIALVDAPAAPLFDVLKDGDWIEVRDGQVFVDGEPVGKATILDVEQIALRLETQRELVGTALEEFAANTMDHLLQERELLTGQIDLPAIKTRFRDRHVLMVVRGSGYREDLRALRAYIRDVKPLLVGVDGGADAILAAGLRPDVILGDMDSASDETLRSGAELIVHAYPDGRAPGQARLEELNLEHTVVPAPGTSQDVAMLLAAEKGAGLIVTVGSHYNLVEFLEKNRAGMSSTFLTRLRVGEILVVPRACRAFTGRRPGRGCWARWERPLPFYWPLSS